MKLEAAHRLLAAKADEKQAKVFLESLGFTGLQPKLSSEDRISFKYSGMDRRFLDKHFGQPKPTGRTDLYWKFGLDGNIILKEQTHIVVLKNSQRNSKKLAPIETHVPEDTPGVTPKVKPTKPVAPPRVKPTKPVVPPKVKPTAPIPKVSPGYDDPEDKPPLKPDDSPNIPGANDNDDSKVPVTRLSPELEKQYKYTQGLRDAGYMLSFNKKLWMYLNEHKFGGQLRLPRLGLMKKTAAHKMRVRGRWWPSHRLLEVSPNLYNASQNFFVEIFLHEMCHQAVTEIDKSFSPEEAGHGPHWRAWMRKVGLNPLRFDPNDNTTYMTPREKEEFERKKEERQEKKEIVQQQIQDQGMQRMYRVDDPCPATVNWNHKIYHGMVACATGQNRARFAFVPTDMIYGDRHLLVPAENIFRFAGTPEQLETCKGSGMTDKVQRIVRYYKMKSDRRSMKRDIRRQYGW